MDIKNIVKCEPGIQSHTHTVTVNGSHIIFNIEIRSLRLKPGSSNPSEHCSVMRSTAEYLLSSLGYNVNDIENLTNRDHSCDVTQEFTTVKEEPIDAFEPKPIIDRNHENHTKMSLQIVRPEICLVDVRQTHPHMFSDDLPHITDEQHGDDYNCKIELDICKDEAYENQGSECFIDYSVTPTNLSHRNVQNGELTEHMQSLDHEAGIIVTDSTLIDATAGNDTRRKPYKCSQCQFQSKKSSKLKDHMRTHRSAESYRCVQCAFTCRKLATLVDHMNVHDNEKLYKCFYCAFSSQKSSKVNDHIKIHHKTKIFKCTKCDYSTKLSVLLKKHMEIHKNERYKCALCNKFRCKEPVSLKKHMSTHIPSKVYKCSCCHFNCKKSETLRQHMKDHRTTQHVAEEDNDNQLSDREPEIEAVQVPLNVLTDASDNNEISVQPIVDEHSDNFDSDVIDKENTRQTLLNIPTGNNIANHKKPSNYSDTNGHETTDNNISVIKADRVSDAIQSKAGRKIHKCSQCQYKTAHSGHFNVHTRVHTGERPYKCSRCPYMAATSSRLVIHKRTHAGDKPYKCDTCSYKTAYSHVIPMHRRTHTGEKPYTCNVCSYRTAYSSNLVVHKRTHTGDKPYKCDTCSYRTAHPTRLLVHKRIHSGDKPYKCDTCSYRTAHPRCLLVHKRIHSGDKPYKCTVCNFRTARSGTLVVHKRTHTGEKPYTCNMCSYRTADSSNLVVHKRTHTRVKPYKEHHSSVT